MQSPTTIKGASGRRILRTSIPVAAVVAVGWLIEALHTTWRTERWQQQYAPAAIPVRGSSKNNARAKAHPSGACVATRDTSKSRCSAIPRPKSCRSTDSVLILAFARLQLRPLQHGAKSLYGAANQPKRQRTAGPDPLRTLSLVAYPQPEPTKRPSIFRPVTSLDSQL